MIDGRIEKRSVRIAGHRTSVSLEPAFWAALKAVAERRGMSVNRLIEAIDRDRATAPHPGNLSSAIRVFVLAQVQEAAPPAAAAASGPAAGPEAEAGGGAAPPQGPIR